MSSTAAILRYTYEGTSDEVTTCDCCGKTDLKSTVAIHDDEQGETLFFGSTCAARALKVSIKEVTTSTKAADRAKAEVARLVADKARTVEQARWVAYLVEKTGGIRDWSGHFCTALMVQALGGFAAARSGYAEAVRVAS